MYEKVWLRNQYCHGHPYYQCSRVIRHVDFDIPMYNIEVLYHYPCLPLPEAMLHFH